MDGCMPGLVVTNDGFTSVSSSRIPAEMITMIVSRPMNPEKHLQDVVCDRGGDNGRWSRDGSPQPRLSRRYYPWWGPWLSLASNGLGAEIKQSQVSLVLQWQWRGLWLHKTYLKEENNHGHCCSVFYSDSGNPNLNCIVVIAEQSWSFLLWPGYSIEKVSSLCWD